MWSDNSGQRVVLSISGKPRRVIQTCLESLCLKGYSSSKMQHSCISWFILSLPSSLPPFYFFFPPSLHLSLSISPLFLSLCMRICTIESIWRPEDNLGVCVLTFHSSVLLEITPLLFTAVLVRHTGLLASGSSASGFCLPIGLLGLKMLASVPDCIWFWRCKFRSSCLQVRHFSHRAISPVSIHFSWGK